MKISTSLLFDMALAFGLNYFRDAGKVDAVNALMQLDAAKQSGQNIDAELRQVAAMLKAGVEPDWKEITERRQKEVAELLARK